MALDAEGDPTKTSLARQAVTQVYSSGMYDAAMDLAANTALLMMKGMFESGGQRMTQAQDSILNVIVRDVMAEVTPQSVWVDAMIPLYVKTYSTDDLKRLVELQATPFGQRLLAAQATLTREGAKVGEAIMTERQALFGRRLSEEIGKRMPNQ